MSKLILPAEMRHFGDSGRVEAENHEDPAVRAVIAETRRELALFAAEMMGAQAQLGQFDTAGRPVDRRRFRHLVEDATLPYLVIDPRPGLRIVEANAAYAAATMVNPRRIAGERMFDVFPDNPDRPDADGVSNLFGSLQKAAQTGRPHAMSVQRYDVRDAGGDFVARYWQPLNQPVFDDAGRLVYLLHHVMDVTEKAVERI